MFEGTVTEAELGHRYIIERPRLTQLLDESNARIILLLAPAGYGKTTLARQWLTSASRRVAWFTAAPASGDVAGLIAELTRALDPLFPDLERKMVRRLRASQAPATDAESLGRALADATRDWPADLWLALDDYQFIAESRASDMAFGAFADTSNVRLLLTSRTRPAWATVRRALYDELKVVGFPELRLTRAETLEVLRDQRRPQAERIADHTEGWPAVVRMAALAGDANIPDPSIAGPLHSYFADEIFRAAAPSVRRLLVTLLPYPTLDEGTVRHNLRGSRDHGALRDGVDLGFLTRAPDGSLDLHPLLRDFLETKARDLPNYESLYLSAFNDLVERRRWDDAFDVAVHLKRPALTERLLEAALACMLDANRLTTLTEWIAFGTSAGGATPMVALADAAVASRNGRYGRSEARALFAAQNLGPTSAHVSRAYALASEAARLGLRDREAVSHAKTSEEHAASPDDLRRAIWAQLLAVSQSEGSGVEELLHRLQGLHDGTASMTLRLLIARQVQAGFEGNLKSIYQEARRWIDLVREADDPFTESSFLHRMTFLSVLVAEYEEARTLCHTTFDLVEEAGLTFARPHATACAIAMHIGLRQYEYADALLNRLATMVSAADEGFQRSNWHALRARLLLCIGSLAAAASEVAIDIDEIPTVSLRGEFLGLRALAVASSTGGPEVDRLIETTLEISRDVQARTLARLAAAVVALREERKSADDTLATAGELLAREANYDSLVTAYRSFPPLLLALHESAALPPSQLARVVRNAHDRSLAASVGWNLEPARNPRPLLSARERDVYDLLRQGLMNKEIATKLFISESTVKVHVRHILEKLGARTRTEAVIRLQNDD